MIDLFYPYDAVPVIGEPVQSEEMLPIVDPSGMVISQAPRSLCHTRPDLLHPVVHMHIINRYGEIYLQHRSETKDLCPGMWDVAVGGHISFGEQTMEALVREAGEELGFFDFNPIFLDTFLFQSDLESELAYVFAAVGQFELNPNNDEVSEGRWWKTSEIDKNLHKGIFTPIFVRNYKLFKKSLLALL